DRAYIEDIGVCGMCRDSVNAAGDFIGRWRVGLAYAAPLGSRSDRLPGPSNGFCHQLACRYLPVEVFFVEIFFKGLWKWTVKGRISQGEAPGNSPKAEIHYPKGERLPSHLVIDSNGVWSGFENEFRA